MPRRLIKRYLPHTDHIRKHRHLRLFGDLLHDPDLWHLNRRSVAGAVGMGLFMAMVPLPFQMVMAAAAAIVLRVNLPLSVLMVWTTNPLTITPIFFFNYKLGSWMLGRTPRPVEFEPSVSWLLDQGSTLWPPLVLGSLAVGLVAGIAGYGTVRLLWRLHVVRSRRRSAANRR